MTAPRNVWAIAALLYLWPTVLWAGQDKDFQEAQWHYKLQEWQLACDGLEKFLAAYKDAERAEQARLLLGESYYRLKQYDRSATEFARHLRDYPKASGRMNALQRAVKTHYLAKKYQESVDYSQVFLNECLPQLDKPDSLPNLPKLVESVYYYGGESAYALKNFKLARSWWEAQQKRFSDADLFFDAAEGLGWLAFEQEQYEEAARQFGLTATQTANPKAPSAQLMQARALAKLGKLEEALAAVDRVVPLAGSRGDEKLLRETRLYRAAFLLEAKKYEPAVAAYLALAKQDRAAPETAQGLVAAAIKLEQDQRPAEALELSGAYLTGFTRAQDRSSVARIQARALAALKRNEDARAAAAGAVKEAEVSGTEDRKEQLAASLMLLGEYDGAKGKESYLRLIKELPDSSLAPIAQYQLAYLYWTENAFEEVLKQAALLLKHLETKPQEKELKRKTLYAAADAAFRLDRYAVAEPYLKSYAALPEVQAASGKMQLDLVELRMAWCREKASDHAGAMALLEKALQRSPSPELKEEMLYLRGRSRLQLGQLDQATLDFTALKKEAPDARFTAHACFDLADSLYGKGKFAETLPWLDHILDNAAFRAMSFRADALSLRAKSRYRAGQFQSALLDVDSMLTLAGGVEEKRVALYLKALCLSGMDGKSKEAEAAYGALIDAGPLAATEVRQALLRRGRIRFEEKRYQEAQADFTAFLGADALQADQAERIESALRLAICCRERGERDGAKQWLNKLEGLKLQGLVAFEAPFQLGNLAYEAGDNAAAIQHYKKALDIASRTQEVPRKGVAASWLNLAWAHLRMEHKTEAAESFGQLLSVDPDGAYSAEARLHRGQLLAEAGDSSAAVALWKELLEKNAGHELAEKALGGIGEVQAKSGNYKEAAITFRKYLGAYGQAGQRSERIRDIWCGLGECLAQTKEVEEARKAFLSAMGTNGLDSDLDAAAQRALLGIAELELGQGNAGLCKKHALDLIVKRPSSEWLDVALYLCGKANEDLAATDKAIACYRELILKCPKSPRLSTARERLKALGAPETDEGKADPR